MSRPMSRNGYSWVEGRVADGRDPLGLFNISTCRVESGDYLERIASQVGVRLPNGQYIHSLNPSLADRLNGWNAIAAVNPHINPSRIYPGLQLRLPTNRLGVCTNSSMGGTATPFLPSFGTCDTHMSVNPMISQPAQSSTSTGCTNPADWLFRQSNVTTFGSVYGAAAYAGVGGGASIYVMYDSTGRSVVFLAPQIGVGLEGKAYIGQLVTSEATLDQFSGIGAAISAGISIVSFSAGVTLDNLCNNTASAGADFPTSAGASFNLSWTIPIWDSKYSTGTDLYGILNGLAATQNYFQSNIQPQDGLRAGILVMLLEPIRAVRMAAYPNDEQYLQCYYRWWTEVGRNGYDVTKVPFNCI